MIDTKIKDKKNCVGCYACLNECPQECITMKLCLRAKIGVVSTGLYELNNFLFPFF